MGYRIAYYLFVIVWHFSASASGGGGGGGTRGNFQYPDVLDALAVQIALEIESQTGHSYICVVYIGRGNIEDGLTNVPSHRIPQRFFFCGNLSWL